MGNATKGYEKVREFDRLVAEWGWVKLAGEHRLRWGGVCNICGFDRLYVGPQYRHPILVEVTDHTHRTDRLRRIIERYPDAQDLVPSRFVFILATYYGGHRKLDRRMTEERRWTKSGTWRIEEVIGKETIDVEIPPVAKMY